MATAPATFQVYAGYRQFYVLDPDGSGDTGSPDFWTQEAMDLRLAVQPGVLGIATDTDGDVPVTIETLDMEPPQSLEGWHHVVEAPLHLSMGRVALAPCPDADRPLATIALGPGWYRVRVHSAGLSIEPPSQVEHCGDSYLVLVWPSGPGERTLLKGFRS
jgi:hypothetical protein